MNKVSRSCKVSLLYVWVVFVVIGSCESAPSGSKVKNTATSKVGPRIKRCENLINILSNMLLEHFPRSDWDDFVEVPNDEEYPIIDWHEQGFRYPKDVFKNNFILYKDQSDTIDAHKRFSSRVNYNYHQPPKGIKQDAYFFEMNHQPSKSNLNRHWQSHIIGNDDHVLGGSYNKPVRENLPDDLDDSSSDWHKVLPSRQITEIDEAIQKNFFKSPPMVGPPVKTKESRAPNWIKSLTRNTVHRCIPEHTNEDFVKSILNGTELMNATKNVKDGYFVLLIKKDQLLEDGKKEQNTETENNETFKISTQIVGKDNPTLTTTESGTTSTPAPTEAHDQTSTVEVEIYTHEAKVPIVGSVVNIVEENYGKEQSTETVLITSTINDPTGYEEDDSVLQTTTTEHTTEPLVSHSSTESEEIHYEESETTLPTTTIENTSESINQSSISYSSTQYKHESKTKDIEHTTTTPAANDYLDDFISSFGALS